LANNEKDALSWVLAFYLETNKPYYYFNINLISPW